VILGEEKLLLEKLEKDLADKDTLPPRANKSLTPKRVSINKILRNFFILETP
jgi:hypothetical protein